MAAQIPFETLVHCTHWTEAGDMVENLGEGNFQVNFVPNEVGSHHRAFANTLAANRVVWFGIIPNPQEAYRAPLHGAHPAFNAGSRYGPFSFQINVNTVFEKYRQLCNAENFQALFFYRIIEDQIYSRERSEIIVVSAVEIFGLTSFIPAAESTPCSRSEADGNATWEWTCQNFQSYQDNETHDYYQLEFVFVFAAQEDGEFPTFSFTVGINPDLDLECLATSNRHEEASICIPFQNRWNDERKGLTCIMVKHPGSRSTVRARSYQQALLRHGLNKYDGWRGIHTAICEKGGCNNPQFAVDRSGNGVQTAAFAAGKLEEIFA